MDAPAGVPPWGRLIDEERDRQRPAISQNEAAKRAGISGTRWRQIVDGRAGAMDSDRGVQTVARMAEVAGVKPDQMEQVGRPDVAGELRLLLGEPRHAAGTGRISVDFEATAQGTATPAALVGLPEDLGERINELSKRLDRNAEEQQQISAELARLLGRTNRDGTRETG